MDYIDSDLSLAISVSCFPTQLTYKNTQQANHIRGRCYTLIDLFRIIGSLLSVGNWAEPLLFIVHMYKQKRIVFVFLT